MLGHTVTDRITGFKGVVVGVVNYISGCEQALVQPPVDKDGKIPESQWLDVQRLNASTGDKPIVLQNTGSPGFDRAPPRR